MLNSSKKLLGLLCAVAQLSCASSVDQQGIYGMLNPSAPPQVSQYAFMIGTFDCHAWYREFRDGHWVEAGERDAVWTARYVLDGYAIMDEYRDETSNNVVVRVFDPADNVWRIQYARANPTVVRSAAAREVDGNMVMLTEQVSPSGHTYSERVTFHPLADGVYRWTQEVVYSPTSSVIIFDMRCARRSTAH
ncbi:MAG: hypothetical protein R3C27_10810 [Hyphomonadaceae bacterium]